MKICFSSEACSSEMRILSAQCSDLKYFNSSLNSYASGDYEIMLSVNSSFVHLFLSSFS